MIERPPPWGYELLFPSVSATQHIRSGSSRRFSNSAACPVTEKARKLRQGKPPPLVSRSPEAARRRRPGSAGDAACPARRWLDRAGSGARRSRNGARGKGSGKGALGIKVSDAADARAPTKQRS